ncbi:GNAT family N-acetyltransferase [Serratia quinivorans]|uniref:GNAT family N-acetyltransferase n=1 Tax=Serratia quinivorans TaxID=137545 RepID=UPI00217885EB|nr:GNAT family N-acetyltransferase [Serratia quinivorans]CAI0977535.1 Predicted acetyltransferase [Serratia quinivorans]CAI1169357.1 Predicted acetyltransferase [Serratia quinivorans]CAI1846843.1 Predicted acetyltransferase [Serratia quinivorans]CAI2107019.1 Predicted acetyltransferase [Serratia quinivorans]CAI2132706.1 Predicted acetyltransferase [Serratia quinivorans]
MTNIALLADYPQHRQQVIDWLWQAFGSENSRAFFASVVDSGLCGADLPITFIALQGDELVGTVGLWRCDLISRQDLTPWLAALYVDESQRGSGLGLRLQQHVQDYSRQAGFNELYLYSDFSGYYERHGWHYIGDALDYPDRPVRVYYRELN